MNPSKIVQEALGSGHSIIKNNMHNILSEFKKAYGGSPLIKVISQSEVDLLFSAFVSGMICVMNTGSDFNTKYVADFKAEEME